MHRWANSHTWSAVLAFLVIPVAFSQADWPMYQGNAGHTGHVPVFLNPHGFSLRWDRTIGASLNPLAAAEGKVFVSRQLRFKDETGLYALDALTGETLWTKAFGSIHAVNPPSYSYGNVYIQTGRSTSNPRSYLRAYDAETGNIVFQSTYWEQWEKHYAPTIYDGKVYINGGYFGGMYTFDAGTGAELWFKRLNQYDQWTPAIRDEYVYAYVGACLYVINRSTGEILDYIHDPNFYWHGWSMNLAPVLGDRKDIFVIQHGRLICFDLVQRNIRWEIHGEFAGQPSVARGVVYAVDDGILTAHDEMTGELLWWWEAAGGNLSGQVIVTNMHVLVFGHGTLYAISLLTHTDVWSCPTSGLLALDNENLYISPAYRVVAFAIALTEPVEMRFTPHVLNPLSRGRWVKAHFVLPEEFTIADVDSNSPAKILEPVEVQSAYMNVFMNEEALVEVEIAFDRASIAAMTNDGVVDVVVAGPLTEGRYFYGTDTIKVLSRSLGLCASIASHWLEASCCSPDWCGGLDVNHDAIVNFLDFALYINSGLKVLEE